MIRPIKDNVLNHVLFLTRHPRNHSGIRHASDNSDCFNAAGINNRHQQLYMHLIKH